MIKRPNKNETLEDILAQQREFETEKAKNPQFPAATAVKVENKERILSRIVENCEIREQQDAEKRAAYEAHLKTHKKIVFGDIVERVNVGPTVMRRRNERPKKSLFAQRLQLNKDIELSSLMESKIKLEESEIPQTPANEANMEFDADKFMQNMSEAEILEAQKELMQTTDPKLLLYLKNKHKTTKELEIKEKPLLEYHNHLEESNAAAEILQLADSGQWLNFDKVEREKLEWLSDIPKSVPKLQPGQKYEARFDWKGVLLPYAAELQDSDLYLHGDEPQRAGYTLQELFRLARSEMLQQRIIAFSVIEKLLGIYQQGFYDNVLQLPISKTFFLLRLGFDENVLPILEVVGLALSRIFYNEIDEHFLDLIFDTSTGYWQPILAVPKQDDENDELNTIANLQQQMSKMLLEKGEKSTGTSWMNVAADEEISTDTITDFHMAETDLMLCFLRTNMVERIRYILFTIRPNNSTVLSCLKLLIRLARTSRRFAFELILFKELFQFLHKNFLPPLLNISAEKTTDRGFYGEAQPLCLKLLRVLAAHGFLATRTLSQTIPLPEILAQYLNSNSYLKLQIEALRLLHTINLLRFRTDLYEKFSTNLYNMLLRHYQCLDYEIASGNLWRQHASALLATIVSGANAGIFNYNEITNLNNILFDCCCKWFFSANKYGVKEISQINLLSACLHAYRKATNDPTQIMPKCVEFKIKYLTDFVLSKSFLDLLNNISTTSLLLSTNNDRRFVHKPLPNLGSVIVSSESGPYTVIANNYPFYLLHELLCLIDEDLKSGEQLLYATLFNNTSIMNTLIAYLARLSENINIFAATNFFADVELRFVLKLLNYETKQTHLSKTQLLNLSTRLLTCLPAEFIKDIKEIFKNVIFNPNYLEGSPEFLKSCSSFYLEHLVAPHTPELSDGDVKIVKDCTVIPILSADWPYYPLRLILHYFVKNTFDEFKKHFTEKSLIEISLNFAQQLDAYTGITPTQKLIYFMIMFMGPDSLFLQQEIDALLRKHIMKFFAEMQGRTFDFESSISGLSSFETIYYMFVDHFQASSYGNNLFSALIMIPLAQNYDPKFRKRMWSDLSIALNYINCNEDLLINGLEAYLHPAETDESLLRDYSVAVTHASPAFKKTVVYKIAQHHLQTYKNRQQNMDT